MKVLEKSLLAVLVVLCCVGVSDGAPRKRIIAHSWDLLSATTEDVWRNRSKFAVAGFDGIAMPLDRMDASGRLFPGRGLINDMAVHGDVEYESSVRLVRECVACEGLGWSLGFMTWTPTNRIAWLDDARWDVFAQNAGTFARAAKAAGLVGLVVDHEDYSRTKQFRWQPCDGAFAAAAKAARARGRQVFGEMFREFPDAVLLSFWLFSEERDANLSSDPIAMAECRGDLWGPFLNGLLDVLPPTAKIVEGNETAGYLANAQGNGFAAAAWECARPALARVTPENRSKFSSALSVGFGLYLDACTVKEGSFYDCGKLGGSRPAKFYENLFAATRIADDVVWIYGERGLLVPWDRKLRDFDLWEHETPGLAAACRAAVGDSVGFARVSKAWGWSVTNLLSNSGCNAAGDGKIPPPFGTYTSLTNPPAGLFAYDLSDGAKAPGCLRVSGDGSFTVSASGLRPGDIIRVELSVKGRGAGANVGWRKDGTWNWKLGCKYLAPKSDADSASWHRLGGFFIVPEGADGVGVVMGGQLKTVDPVSFDDISIFKLVRSASLGN